MKTLMLVICTLIAVSCGLVPSKETSKTGPKQGLAGAILWLADIKNSVDAWYDMGAAAKEYENRKKEADDGVKAEMARERKLSPESRYTDAMRRLAQVKDARDRFYHIADAAKTAFEVGKKQEAKKYAEELLSLSEKYRKDWNYGNAVHDGNMVLGRIALAEGKPDKAGEFLLKAGDTPGSPQLNSFGPNMNLARDLAAQGKKDVVIKYFSKCARFWTHKDLLDNWTNQVNSGKTPDFGANLLY